MGRLLREEDVIKKIEWWFGKLKQNPDRLVDAIKTTHAVNDWIPCSERLPKSNGVYNVTRIINDGFTCANITDTCYFDGVDTWHDDTRVNHGRKYVDGIIAWKPLPEPYMEDNDGNIE